MNTKKKLILPLITISAILSGCSTVFNSGSQVILAHPSSEQKDVKVEVTSPSGSYPTTLPTVISTESSHNDVTIQVVDKCYDNTTTKVNKHVTPSFFVNVLAWPGFIVDLATGKMWKYDNNVTIPLKKRPECENKVKI